MVQSKATSVKAYVESLPADRQRVINSTLKLVRKHLPKGYEEGMMFGMIGWYVPFSVLPETYNKQPLCYAGLAAQKQYTSLYLMTVYGGSTIEKDFRAAFAKAGKKLNMGKCCLRYNAMEDIEQSAVAKAISALSVEEFVQVYHKSREGTAERRKKSVKKAGKKGSAKSTTVAKTKRAIRK